MRSLSGERTCVSASPYISKTGAARLARLEGRTEGQWKRDI